MRPWHFFHHRIPSWAPCSSFFFPLVLINRYYSRLVRDLPRSANAVRRYPAHVSSIQCLFMCNSPVNYSGMTFNSNPIALLDAYVAEALHLRLRCSEVHFIPVEHISFFYHHSGLHDIRLQYVNWLKERDVQAITLYRWATQLYSLGTCPVICSRRPSLYRCTVYNRDRDHWIQ